MVGTSDAYADTVRLKAIVIHIIIKLLIFSRFHKTDK
jgi:hypothetical protein